MRRFAVPFLAFAALALWLLWPEARTHEQAPARAARNQAVADEAPRGGARFSTKGVLEGVVLDPRGAPAAGAQVHALVEERAVAEAAADAAGRWRIDGLGAGDYTVQARRGGEVSAPLGPIPLAPGETLGALDLHLEPALFLSGAVRDAATGDAIAGARVDGAGLAAAADHAGRFRLEGLGRGPLTLRATAAGYQPRTWPLELERSLRGLEIFLERGATVRGRVVAGDAPVAGAAVAARRYGFGTDAGAAPPTATGADGGFTLDVPAGQVELIASGPDGGSGVSAPLGVAPGAVVEGIEIRLDAPAALAGTVVDPAGNPAAHAAVQVASLEGAALAEIAADGAGRFHFDRIAGGMVRVVARHGAALGATAPLALAPGALAEVTVRLGAGAVAGRVEDPSGRGIAGARVLAWSEGTPASASTSAVTDGDGAFALEGLPAGPLRIEAIYGARRTEARGVQPGGAPLRLVLGDGALVGAVLAGGRPATDFTISASAADPGRAGGAVRRIVGADGAFRLELPPGRYEVRASAPGAGVARAFADVPGSGDSEQLLLEIAEGGAVEGVVLDAETRQPIGGVRISTSRNGTFAFGQNQAIPAAPQALSAPDGTFRLTGLAADRRHPIFAWKPGYRGARPPVVTVAPGATERIELTLAGGGEEQSAFGGVGITLGLLRGALVAASVIEGGPGWEAGVRVGDRILAVDGVAVDAGSLATAAEKIRGPVGTAVSLDLVRGDSWFRATPLRAELRF